jgi:hypothetical protein
LTFIQVSKVDFPQKIDTREKSGGYRGIVEDQRSYREIAAQFNVSKVTIMNVIKLFRALGGVPCRFIPVTHLFKTPK